MATHSSVLAWRIPWTEEPGRLQSMGSQRVKSIKQLKKLFDGHEKLFYRLKKLFDQFEKLFDEPEKLFYRLKKLFDQFEKLFDQMKMKKLYHDRLM